MPEADSTTRRPDLSDRRLIGLVAAALVLLAAAVLASPTLPPHWLRPGSPLLQSAAIAGSLLLLVPFLFSLGKRAGASRVPNRLFIAHVGASLLGGVLVGVHALAGHGGPPLVIVACLVLIVLTGVYARLRVAEAMAATLGTKAAPFAAPDPVLRERLGALIARKRAVLERLDPSASEAVFSVTLAHWLRAPRLSLAYARLTREESRLIGARGSVGWVQAWWRPLHLVLAWLFLAALLVHVIVVTLFAGYAADGPIYWWHLTDWGR